MNKVYQGVIIIVLMQTTKPSLFKRRTAYSLNSKTVRPVKAVADEVQLQKLHKGFHPFCELSQPSMYSTMNDFTLPLKNSLQIPKQTIDTMLSQNKTRLGAISQKVSQKRHSQYQAYMNNNTRYNLLLQLNNNRSKVMTSLKSNIGQVIIKLIEQHKPEDFEFVAQFHNVPISSWKPQSRQGQLCIIYKDNLYLFGGHSSNPIGEVCTYNFKQSTWTKLEDAEVKRSYHSGVLYKQHYFIIFGGMSKYNVYYKARQCLNSICLFSPLVHGVKEIKIQNEHIVEARRSHSACIVGKQMLIFGGINMYRQYLKDLKYLDLRDLKWVELDYRIETPQLEQFLAYGIAKHVMIANFKQRQGHAKLYHKDYASDQGIFIFGGTNKIGIRSVVIHISFKKRVLRFHKLFPSGYLPTGVSLIASKVNQNIIAVISGERFERQMKLYKIKENEFVGVHYHMPHLGGIGSSIVNYKDQMYILFGVGEKGYIGSMSSFTLQEKLKTQLQKEVKKQRRHSMVHKDFRIAPNFFKDEL